MKRLPIWFEQAENLAIAAAVVAAFVYLHFSWWWLPVLFLAFDASMAGYLNALVRVRRAAVGLPHRRRPDAGLRPQVRDQLPRHPPRQDRQAALTSCLAPRPAWLTVIR
jgi:hypothetical protein